ncbi:hypothetical protein ABDI30_03030 [Paenibacillus cisolokensis]|uniref:hypothetical protein n=1 Tax=Paenibacillus cisolokensis TaxID=1658519 RepID=UPI003D28F7A5
MSKVRNHTRIFSSVALSVLLSLSLTGGAFADSASDLAPGALTSPPPVEAEFVPFAALNANLYLSHGSSTIRQAGSNQVQVTARTYAYQTVNSVGVNYNLQRWTGTEWINIASFSDSVSSRSSYDGLRTWSVSPGYYYRAHTVHWVNHGGTYESATYYTNSVLIPL